MILITFEFEGPTDLNTNYDLTIFSADMNILYLILVVLQFLEYLFRQPFRRLKLQLRLMLVVILEKKQMILKRKLKELLLKLKVKKVVLLNKKFVEDMPPRCLIFMNSHWERKNGLDYKVIFFKKKRWFKIRIQLKKKYILDRIQ